MNILRRGNRTILGAFGDTHGGHILGLLNPETKLKTGEGGYKTPQLNQPQEYLWEIYTKHIKQLMEFADGDDICLLHMGDVTQGKVFGTQLVSTKTSDQFSIAYYNFVPWLEHKNVKYLRMVIGTSVHIFGEGTSEDIIEERIKSSYPNINIRSMYHSLLDYKGVTIDYSHHGPSSGIRNWLKGNEARYYMRSLMWDELACGNKPPHIIMRGHYHTSVKEYLSIRFDGKEYESWLYVLPSYCMMDEYAIKSTKSQFQITNGMIAIEIKDGKLGKPLQLLDSLDVRTKEKIE